MPDTLQTEFARDAFDPRAFLGQVGTGKATERYRRNQKIFSQGEIASTVYFIHKGKVKITVLSEHGKEAVVGIFSDGQFFGEACLEGVEIRTTTSHAMEDCLITSITRSAMLAALNSQPNRRRTLGVDKLPTNQGVFVGSYAAVAQMLDELAAVPGVHEIHIGKSPQFAHSLMNTQT